MIPLRTCALTVIFQKRDNFYLLIAQLTNNNTTKHPRPVRIAVLDTGIDLSHKEIKICVGVQIQEMKSWISDQTGTTDEDSHGTYAAMLLLQVAPRAPLYIASLGFRGITKEHIAPAILWAVNNWQFDIVVMSFGFKRYSDEVSEAVSHAVRADVLIFVAAASSGENEGIPYHARDYLVFCITQLTSMALYLVSILHPSSTNRTSAH